MTEESEDMDDIPKKEAPTPVIPPAPPVKAEVECDPLTMNCNEMPKTMETLIRKEGILTEGIEKIKELQKTFPGRKELDELHSDAVRAKEKIHGTISDITTRFSMCTLKEEKAEKKEEKGEPETSENPM